MKNKTQNEIMKKHCESGKFGFKELGDESSAKLGERLQVEAKFQKDFEEAESVSKGLDQAFKNVPENYFKKEIFTQEFKDAVKKIKPFDVKALDQLVEDFGADYNKSCAFSIICSIIEILDKK
jgi:hypothetical protein